METLMDDVLIFSKQTSVGTFEIRTPRSTFDITFQTYGQTYSLHLSSDPEFIRSYPEPYDALRAVSQHNIGHSEWDAAAESVSDYADDWTRHFDKKFKMLILGNYVDANPDASYRELIDYFEHKHSYLCDRIEIGDLLTELITTGQIDKPLDDWMVPSDLRDASEIANDWLGDKPDDKST